MVRKSLFSTYILLGFILVHYQNCAQPENNWEKTTISSQAPGDGRVQVINAVEVGAISFPAKVVSATSLLHSDLVGLCEQNGSIISWTLRDLDGLLVERGSSACDRGSFAVEINTKLPTDCASDLRLKAAMGAKAASEVTIVTECNS